MNSSRRGRIAVIGTTIAAVAATSVGFALHQVSESQDAARTYVAPTQTTISDSTLGGTDSDARLRVSLTKTTNQIGAVVDPTSSMQAYLTASYTDVAQTWTRLFAGWGYQAPTAQPVFPEAGQAMKTGCRPATNDETMEYCALDDSIVFNEQAAHDVWVGKLGRRTQAGTGGMSVTLLIAHEYGHNIEAELNRWGGGSKAAQAARERGADCFAGVWADDAAHRGILDSADVSAAYAALDLVADNPEQGLGDGVHGTAAERRQAYEIGATRGANACVDAYLSELSGVPTATPSSNQPGGPTTDQSTQPTNSQPGVDGTVNPDTDLNDVWNQGMTRTNSQPVQIG